MKDLVSYCFYLLLPCLVSAQSCPEGALCTLPKDLTSDSPVTIEVSSHCNGSYEYQGNEITCDGLETQLKNLRDKSVDNDVINGIYETFWASRLTDNLDGTYKEEFITLNFKDVFLIEIIQVAFAKNERSDLIPKAMEIQGLVNNSWATWKYFASNCAESYGKSETDVMLGSYKSCENPTPNEYSTVTFNPRLSFVGAWGTNETVQRFFMASAIKIILKRPADLKPNSSYYIVSDIDIRYRCACLGHASECGGSNEGVCACQHNTAGNNCEKCKPLYNNATWQMGSGNNFHCLACDCNNRSESCEFDAIDMSGKCTNCLFGTSGKHCENCADGYFINPSGNASYSPDLTCKGFDGNVSIEYNCHAVCIPCNCSIAGSTNYGKTCDLAGQCLCKSNVQGAKCSTCKDGSYNLQSSIAEGCSRCSCDNRGMLTCNKTNAMCICKNNTMGSNCESCQTGFYNLSSDNSNGCSYCDCDFGASSSIACDAVTGICACRPSTATRTCSSTVEGFFGPRLDFYTFEAEYSTNVSLSHIVERVGGGRDGSTFTGRGFLSVTHPAVLTFSVRVLTSAWYQVVVRYESDQTFDVAITVTPSSAASPTCQNSTIASLTGSIYIKDRAGFSLLRGSSCFDSEIQYELKLDIPFTQTAIGGSGILIDSIVLFPVAENLTAFVNGNDSVKSKIKSCFVAGMVVNSDNRTSLGCPSVDYSIMIDFRGRAYECNCDPLGSYNQSCSPLGGQCYCKPNVFLRNCSQCSVNSYGLNKDGSCIDCGCHLNASTSLKCDENGTCLCKANVTGQKCDRCLANHFGLTTGLGCRLCSCSGPFVVNDSCLDSGQCFCKPGVSGMKCDACMQGHYGLTTSWCSACRCNAFGSLASSCDPTSGACNCRENVAGFLCDSCKSGYFGLGPYSSRGCMECYCSGVTRNCTSALGWFQALCISGPSLENLGPFSRKWSGVDQNGNSVAVEVASDLNSLFYWKITNSNGTTLPVYFASPKRDSEDGCFTGFKASSYGQWLNMTLMFDQYPPATPIEAPFKVPFSYPDGDVIIRGVNVPYTLGASLNVTSPGTTNYSIRIDESSWFKNNSGIRPTYDEMIQVLYDVQSILIRAKFSEEANSTASLISVSLGYGVNNSLNEKVPLSNVEQCICPSPYEGRFCGQCSAGFTKVGNKCVPCSCNGHEYPGTSCDPVSGKCNCTHNTMGNHCDLCKGGYYGDATLGLPESCKPCMCPGNVNDPNALFHSKPNTCDPSGSSFTCKCDLGYTGIRCDSCSNGYYGSPSNALINNGECRICSCGNTNECNNVNGECINCPRNTTGVDCAQCKPGYFSDNPPLRGCQACTCNSTGLNNCDAESGLCLCQSGVDPSTNCSTCLSGFYNFSTIGCTSCNCSLEGSNSEECSVHSQVNGICSCKENFGGFKCDQCINQKSGINCNENCFCSTNYTVDRNNSCSRIGQCQCLEGFSGLKCDACSDGAGVNFGEITLPAKEMFPNCVSCGPCFKSLAEKAITIRKNMTDVHNITLYLLSTTFENKEPEDLKKRVENIAQPLNNSESNLKSFEILKIGIDNVTLYDVPARISTHESDLQKFYQNQSSLNTRDENLNKVDQSHLQTGNVEIPQVSFSDTNGTYYSILNSQYASFSIGDAAYKSIQLSSSLIQSQQFMVEGLKARVQILNRSMSQSNQSIMNSLNQIGGISMSTLQLKLAANGQRLKTTENLVNSLNIDLGITQYYLTNTINLHNASKDQLNAFVNQYTIWNLQLSSSGDLQNFSSVSQKATENAANSITQYCNLTQSFNDSLISAIINLSNSKKKIENSNLTKNIVTMNSIISTNIDAFSTQILPVLASINRITLQPDQVANLSRDADNSSSIAQGLTGAIQDAVNKTQQAQTRLNQLLSNLNSSSNMDLQIRNCMSTGAVQSSAISSNVDAVSRKANETKIAAHVTDQAMNNASIRFDPVKKSFTNISDVVTNSLSSLQLTNGTLDAVQRSELQNINRMDLLNSNYSIRLSEYSNWLNSRTQVETCTNDLRSSLDALNKPLKLADVTLRMQSQLGQVNQLISEIKNIENEINVLLLTIEGFGSESAACNEATPGF